MPLGLSGMKVGSTEPQEWFISQFTPLGLQVAQNVEVVSGHIQTQDLKELMTIPLDPLTLTHPDRRSAFAHDAEVDKGLQCVE